METNETDPRYIEAQVERYADTLARIGTRLRDIADRVERDGTPRVGHVGADGVPDYLWAAQQVIHELHWGIANLNVDTLLSAAADAHSAVRGRVK